MSQRQLRKIALKLALVTLRGLIHLKRALTFLFLGINRKLVSLGRWLSRYFLFPLYKLYLFFKKRLAFLIDPITRQLFTFSLGRGLIVIVSLILMAAFIISETKVYAATKYLNGQQSLVFYYVGTESDIDITEDIIEPPPPTRPSPWTTGAVAQFVPFSPGEIPIDEIAGTTLGGVALVQPLFLPGVVFGSGRSKTIYYLVEAGDTFGGMAQKFGVSIETILWANNLTIRSILHPGDVLKILPVSGVAHKVQKGDNIKKIAQLYSSSEDKILEFNHLTDSELIIGEEIIIPDGRVRNTPAVPASLYAVPQRRITAPIPPPSIERESLGFIWPSSSRRITQYFRWRHPGIDIGLPAGNPIYASADGKVELAGWNRGGYGFMILINHRNGIKTRYAHASRLLVAPGEEVVKGQVIGLIGSTGRSSGPHLHFEVIVNGIRSNPLLYVR